VAGTLWYRLKVEHVYQRRFGDPESLAEALATSHWYIISRRPSVRIIAETVRVDDQILTVDFVTCDDITGPERVHTFGFDFSQLEPLSDFRTYADGAYFSAAVGDMLVHGDAWALASLLSAASVDIARQEVLYVGQAFGQGGTGNVWERTRQHQKLQQIYEDHVNTVGEIYVASLSLDRRGFSNDDHIDDAENGPCLDAYYETLADMDGSIRKPAVDLIEHSLISYFAPPYNEKLIEWRADKPTDAMQKMRSVGFRLLYVHLSGWWGLARFYSCREPDPHRSHFISRDLPPTPLKPRVRSTVAEALSGMGMGELLLQQGKAIFADRAEQTGVLLRVFGDLAPAVRKPPNIILPRSGLERNNPVLDTDAHEQVRTVIRTRRKEERRAPEPLRHPGKPTYDPSTGAVSVGISLDGGSVSMRLHDPETGSVDSALILGEPQCGKSNLLRIMIAEAFGSGRFLVLPSDPSGRSQFAKLWSGVVYKDQLIATDVDETIRNLTIARGIIEDRLATDDEWQSEENPAVLVAIDDADIVLQHPLGSRLVTDILGRGGEVGVGLLVVIANISKLEYNIDLMYELVSCRTQAIFMPNGRLVMADLAARYGKRRPCTWRDDGWSFVLHRGGNDTSLGLLTAVTGSDATPAQAQAWCRQQLAEVGINLWDWAAVHGDPRSWWTMEQGGGRFWFLRQHSDEWALVMNVSKMATSDFSETVDTLQWAEEVIANGFTVKLESWKIGPTTGEKDAITLYADVSGDLVPKDTSDLIQQALLSLY
jgi:hypothetical protein